MIEEYHVGLLNEVGGVHEYQFIGGPLDNPGPNKKVLAAFGHSVASWGRMEQHIDAILVQINKAHHSREIIDLFDPTHPPNFSDKLKMLKRYFNQHPALVAYQATVRDITGGLKKLSIERNGMVHGILEDFDLETGELAFNGMQFRRPSMDFLNRRQTFSIDRLIEITRLTNLAHYALCEVSKQIFTPETLVRLKTPL